MLGGEYEQLRKNKSVVCLELLCFPRERKKTFSSQEKQLYSKEIDLQKRIRKKKQNKTKGREREKEKSIKKNR
jgi:hypothetical protein